MAPLQSASQVWRQAAGVLLAQAALAVVASAVMALGWGIRAAVWTLLGGAICIGPSALFAFKLSRAAMRSGPAFGIAFVLGELIKVLLVAALFAITYSRLGGLNALALLVGFIAAIQGYLLALLIA